jgi:hypothetical protein
MSLIPVNKYQDWEVSDGLMFILNKTKINHDVAIIFISIVVQEIHKHTELTYRAPKRNSLP